ncbi:MAG: penicillin-binding transpeptidase domain-containing protein, partial [Angelakisella sp.]
TYTFAGDVGTVARDTILEHSYQLPGVDVIESPVREYVDGTLAPHILGSIGPVYKEDMEALKKDGRWYDPKTNPTGYRGNEYLGKSGIELTYESVLRGKSGERLVSLDYRGNVESVEVTIPPTPGNTVVLTLDRDLQRASQDALEHTIHRYNNDPNLKYEQGKGTNAGAVVVQHVKTGEILAMASYPTYDGSTFLADYAELRVKKPGPLLNRATMGQYRPGSIYKPAVAVAGLTEGVVGLTETINCTHVYTRFSDYPATCMYLHGPIDVMRALQVSCNIFFYETGWRLGIDRMNKYSAQLGLGHPTGIEISEDAGQLSSPATQEAGGDIWTNGDIIQSAIGQLDHLFTPVQMASYTATLANNGVRMQSHLVKATKSYDFKETVSETPVTEIDRIEAPAEVFETVRKGMIAATAAGGTSGWQWTGFPLTVASKTGTPEVVSKADLNAVYICYIPAEDPQIAIAVALENAGSGNVAAPVARLIAEEYFFGGSKSELVRPMGEVLP